MVHKLKEVYRLQWRPVNPDGSLPVGMKEEQWITDPTFKHINEMNAWDKFMQSSNQTIYADMRLVKDGKEVFKRLWKDRIKK
jgi:hypothetical protein